MIGRFIIECDLKYLAVAGLAAEYLVANPECTDVVTSVGEGANKVSMFSKRLKKSIRIQQVKP